MREGEEEEAEVGEGSKDGMVGDEKVKVGDELPECD